MIRYTIAILLTMIGTLSARAETAILAGGCFWCVEADLEGLPGVTDVVTGYTGGTLAEPTYGNHEGHYEAVRVTFDPAVISYPDLIDRFLRSVDVTDADGQFCDRGPSYRSAIFVDGAAQTDAAKAAVVQAEKSLGQSVVTPVLPASAFWLAEDYHQNYAKGSRIVLTRAGPKRQSKAYAFYREACGRDARVQALWGEAAFDR